MSVTVFGSNGFIGRELCKLLRQESINYTGVSRQSSEFVDVQLDITKISDFDKLKSEAKAAVICAAKLPGTYTEESLVEYVNTNVNGTWNILNWAKRSGVKKIIFCSTLSVLGLNAYRNGPASENSNEFNTGAHYQYTSSKHAAEILCTSFCAENDINYHILRIGSVYGAGMPWIGVLCSFIDKIRNGKDIVINDPAFNTDLIHVRDVAYGIYKNLENEQSGIMNIASGTPVTLEEIVDTIMEAGNFPKPDIHLGEESDYPEKLVDVSKFRTLINLRTPVSLSEGIKELIEIGK